MMTNLFKDSFEVLGFEQVEILSLYKCTTAVINFGELKFKQRPREEQAEADGTQGLFKFLHKNSTLNNRLYIFKFVFLRKKVSASNESTSQKFNFTECDKINEQFIL